MFASYILQTVSAGEAPRGPKINAKARPQLHQIDDIGWGGRRSLSQTPQPPLGQSSAELTLHQED